MRFREAAERATAFIPLLSAIAAASFNATYYASKYGSTDGIIGGIIGGVGMYISNIFTIWIVTKLMLKLKKRKN